MYEKTGNRNPSLLPSRIYENRLSAIKIAFDAFFRRLFKFRRMDYQ